MKIAFCIFKYFPFGGIQRDLMKMVAESRSRGHGVRIYAIHWRDDGPLPDGVDLKLVPVKALANHRLYERFADWVRDDLKAEPVDLVVGMNKMPGLDAYYAGDSCYQTRPAPNAATGIGCCPAIDPCCARNGRSSMPMPTRKS